MFSHQHIQGDTADWLVDTKISLTLFLLAGAKFAFTIMFEMSGLTEEAGLLAKVTAAAGQ